MFLGVECECNYQGIADLFARYFHGVYENDASVKNADGYVFDEGLDDPSVLSWILLFTKDDVEDGLMNLDKKKDLVQTELLRRFLGRFFYVSRLH
jgi:hypothetical protein